MPLASNDKQAIEIVAQLVRAVGFDPVPVGDLAMGRYLLPGTPLAGEHSADEIRKIVATLK
jgi:predicted dinucleotide-binding enzyme